MIHNYNSQFDLTQHDWVSGECSLKFALECHLINGVSCDNKAKKSQCKCCRKMALFDLLNQDWTFYFVFCTSWLSSACLKFSIIFTSKVWHRYLSLYHSEKKKGYLSVFHFIYSFHCKSVVPISIWLIQIS